jgi:hypothetical protein
MYTEVSSFGADELDSNYWFKYDPISGSVGTYQDLSANVIAYYKFDEQNSGIVAQDWAGSAVSGVVNSASGTQGNPASGNTMSFFGSSLITGVYNLVDNFDINSSDEMYRKGSVTFQDELGNNHRVGTIYYELGMVVFDGEYNTNTNYSDTFKSASGLPLLSSIGRWGMSFNQSLTAPAAGLGTRPDGNLSTSGITGNVSGFWVQSMYFDSQIDIERMVVNLSATGNEMILSQNPTAVDITTGDQILPEPAGYITAIGLYNDYNDLVGVAKLRSPIRKDTDHDVVTQVFLDF